jgi:L-amino acid N-acyltransferase YncA
MSHFSTHSSPLHIRPSRESDLSAITDIYGWNVENGTGTFELDAPNRDEMTRRRTDVVEKGLPWLVAERSGEVLGYAYANHFRPRLAYRFCLEDSIYLAPHAQGQGIGLTLLTELISRCEDAGARQMIAVIGDSANTHSVRLHAKVGFEHIGVMRSAGWKFERWLDVVLMQRTLGVGNQSPGFDLTRS